MTVHLKSYALVIVEEWVVGAWCLLTALYAGLDDCLMNNDFFGYYQNWLPFFKFLKNIFYLFGCAGFSCDTRSLIFIATCGILSCGMQDLVLELGEWNLSQWTTREVPNNYFKRWNCSCGNSVAYHTHTHTSHTFVRTIIHISSASQLGIVLFPTTFLSSRTFGNMWGQLFGCSSDWGCDNWHLVLMGHGCYVFWSHQDSCTPLKCTALPKCTALYHSALLRNSGKKEKEYINVFGCHVLFTLIYRCIGLPCWLRQ